MGIVDIGRIKNPVIEPQKLHDRLPAAIRRRMFVPIFHQVAVTQESPDIAFVGTGYEMPAHVEKESRTQPPQSAQRVDEHRLGYPEKGHAKIFADFLNERKLPGQQGENRVRHDPEFVVEYLNRDMSGYANSSHSFPEKSGTIRHGKIGKLGTNMELLFFRRLLSS